MDVLDLFERGTEWTQTKIAGAADQLDAQTPCTDWTVRRAIDHLLAGLEMFAGATEGGQVAPPTDPPPSMIHESDPAMQYDHDRKKVAMLYSEPGALEEMLNGANGPVAGAQVLGIAFCDNLIHGWDIAKATGQDATMPDDLAGAAWSLLDGRIPENRREGGSFKAAVAVPADASTQDKLLAYTGRDPR
jgi:uncharacterized protein (TIGR03086 family)